MPKKTFTAAPKPKLPTADEITAYEQGGVGHDQKPVLLGAMEPTAPEAKPAEPIKRLSLDLPASVHTKFKTACSATGRKMVSELTEFIERRTVELEAEAGIIRK